MIFLTSSEVFEQGFPSLKGLSLDSDMLKIPLYLADHATRLIDEALEKVSGKA